jgi:hypothetical protein
MGGTVSEGCIHIRFPRVDTFKIDILVKINVNFCLLFDISNII